MDPGLHRLAVGGRLAGLLPGLSARLSCATGDRMLKYIVYTGVAALIVWAAAYLIYRFHHIKSRKHAVEGMAAGTVLTTAAACLMNAFVLLPAYGKAFGMPVEAFIEMGTAVNPSVNSLLGFVAMIIVPFNLFKYTLTSVIVFFIYKRIRVILKGD